MKELKLLLRKAIFSGKTFIGHYKKIYEILEVTDDKKLKEFFESDKESEELLAEWELLGNQFGVKT